MAEQEGTNMCKVWNDVGGNLPVNKNPVLALVVTGREKYKECVYQILKFDPSSGWYGPGWDSCSDKKVFRWISFELVQECEKENILKELKEGYVSAD